MNDRQESKLTMYQKVSDTCKNSEEAESIAPCELLLKPLSIHRQTKAIVLFLTVFLTGTLSYSQDITGQWNGVLSVQGASLRIVFHVHKTGTGYTSTMDSPDQGARGIPVTAAAFDGSKLSLTVSSIGLTYEGEFKTDSVVGTLKQSGMSFPMTLKRAPVEIKPVVRPQEPKPPYPYRSEEITFENKAAGITLAGTLTMPLTGADFTAVILITGSGAQDRNEEIMGHKPFLVIADYLTRHGIAVLRYDDRGTAKSTGDFRSATTADLAADAESAVAWLKTRKDINKRKIGLMGHSEGGIIATMVAARSKDAGFMVMLAGTGIRGDSLLLLQEELIYRASGMPEDRIAETCKINSELFRMIVHAKGTLSQQEIIDFMKTSPEIDIAAVTPEGMTGDDYMKQFAGSMASPWMQYFLRCDPAPALERVKCPVLAVNGDKDLQVPAKVNLPAISRALKKGGNKNVTVKEYPGLNHLFQECTTGSPGEYASIEQTFSPAVLKDITEWILKF
ncbi:MAG: alpha/beta hydrolase [Bacteroidales bacterium]|jgi:alpha-beta hydrolase superfamily lysophospholipase|nr:alpha/beta hydrolase [Bacteroidales bacterium]